MAKVETTAEPTLKQLLDAAEAAVQAIPAPGPTVAAGAAIERAESALAALWDAARARLFPRELEPLAGLLEELESRLADAHGDVAGLAPTLGETLVDIHKRSIVAHVAMARAIRGVGSARVGAAAKRMAVPLQRPGDELATEAISRFELAVAADLASDGQLVPASSIFSVNLPQLDADLARRKAEHAASGAAAVARIQREQTEADAALDRERQNSVAAKNAEAEGHEKAAAASRRAALLERGEILARRVEALKAPTVRIGGEHGPLYETDDLARGLRRGAEVAFMDRVEAALR